MKELAVGWSAAPDAALSALSVTGDLAQAAADSVIACARYAWRSAGEVNGWTFAKLSALSRADASIRLMRTTAALSALSTPRWLALLGSVTSRGGAD